MDREQLDLWCERGIVGLVLSILVYAPIATGTTKPTEFLVVQALAILALGVWMVRFWVNPGHRIQWPPICWAVIGFVIYAVLRYSQAEVEYVARQELIRVGVYAAVFFLILNNLHRQETTQLLLWVLLGVGALIASYAVFQFLGNSKHVLWFEKPPGYLGRGSGTYISPDSMAGFLEMLVPISLAGLFLSKSSHVTRVFYGYLTLVLLAGIAVSVSRGAYVSTGIALLVFFCILVRYPAYRRAALITLLVMTAGAYIFVREARQPQKRFSLMLTPGQNEDSSFRPGLWKAALAVWKEDVWFGVGPAQFDIHFPAHRPPNLQSRAVWAHNDYINTLADWGLVGSGLIAASMVCLYAGAIKTWKFVHRAHNDLVAKRSDRAANVCGIAVGLVALLCHSWVDFDMQIPANALVAIALMANLTSHLRFATDNYWVTPKLLGRILATVVGAVAVACLGGEWVRGWREQRFLSQSEGTRTYSADIVALTGARSVEPSNPDTVYHLGEDWRLLSWGGGESYKDFAHRAMACYEDGMVLNRLDPYNFLRYGMCLDWLDRHAQAGVFFRRALELDPNNYYITALQGWHSMQTADYSTAREWFLKSKRIKWWSNTVADSYLEMLSRRVGSAPQAPK